MANGASSDTYAIVQNPLVQRMHEQFKTIPSMLGEDTDFQAIDELNDELWRILFDALNVPNGRIRADVIHALHRDIPDYEHTNLATAYETGSGFYDDYFDTRED